MKIIVIGAGASGIVAAISLKRKNPNDEVLVIEHLDKPLKKILATGNGKCNLGNSKLDYTLFNDEEFAKKIIDGYQYNSFFDTISIITKEIDGLVYPISESAVSVRDALLHECRRLKVLINVEEKLVDYKAGEKIEVITNKNKYLVDKLILAGGLKSSPKLGSDGSVIEVLQKHNYKISPLKPGLSPLITNEKTQAIEGIRCKANVRLFNNDALIHEESGEVLFKEHGLSGIVIFNTMSVISRNNCNDAKISIDLLPDYSLEFLIDYCKQRSLDNLLLAFINPKISAYLKSRYEKEIDIICAIKNLEFTFDKSYGYDFSQVTVGGVETSEVNENLMSKHENNVYIIGELLNIDGPCGGYNLTWAFASALKI